MDTLLTTIRREFDYIPEHLCRKGQSTLPDALMSGLAMFILKDPLLLAFDDRRKTDASNLERIFGIQQPPCDTHILELLDSVNPELFRPFFNTLFSRLQSGKVLEPLAYYEGHYLLSLDGSDSFRLERVTSASCLVKNDRKDSKAYFQQILAAAILHPDFQEVVPFFPEIIRKKDRAFKKDLNLDVFQGFVAQLREDQPQLKLIVVDNSLTSNGPRIRDLQKHDMRFILEAKQGNHILLFHMVDEAVTKGTATVFSVNDPQAPTITHRFRFHNDVPLSQTNLELIVNFLGYEEYDAGTNITRRFSWVTDINITRVNAFTLMRAGRVRWKIEDEIHHTLQNQAYHLVGNNSFGKEHLSEVLVVLMMLAFLIDQTQQLSSPLFQAARQKVRSKSALWEQQRNLFHCFELDSMAMMYTTIINGFRKKRPEI